MKPGEERLIELALDELLGRETAPDVTARVLTAITIEAERTTRFHHRLRRMWFAASLLFFVGIAFLVWQAANRNGGGSHEDVHWIHVGRDVEILDGAGELRLDQRLRPGEWLLALEDQVAFEPVHGHELTLHPPAVVTIERDGDVPVYRLLTGTLRLRTGTPTNAAVHTSLGVIAIEEGADVIVSLEGSRVLEPGAIREQLRVFGETNLLHEAILSIENYGSSSGLDLSGREKTSLVAGESAVTDAAGEMARFPVASAAMRTQQDDFLERIQRHVDLRGAGPDAAQRMEAAWLESLEMGSVIDSVPSGWAYARPRLLDVLHRTPHDDVFVRTAGLLCRDEDRRSVRALLAARFERPDAFPVHVLLILAERNVAAAATALKELCVSQGRPPSAQVAAFLAFRGDASGRSLLEEVIVDSDAARRDPAAFMMAASALTRIGDRTIWRRALDRSLLALENSLSAGDLAGARQIVVACEYFAESIGLRDPISVAGFEELDRSVSAEERAAMTPRSMRERVRALLR